MKKRGGGAPRPSAPNSQARGVAVCRHEADRSAAGEAGRTDQSSRLLSISRPGDEVAEHPSPPPTHDPSHRPRIARTAASVKAAPTRSTMIHSKTGYALCVAGLISGGDLEAMSSPHEVAMQALALVAVAIILPPQLGQSWGDEA
eukprot:CAMPEP_0181232176 /NCGR_PEP_ID=MMETSP1096-20121128/35557_1 /TAXON_ID=156174 ORGANISM="Chrysochromulina ericina, Strain CCMP281" /NCGR_SAMPLE_ID=MMETSP1096 /ASSEMBLY_ACC=CAM_ASM_000453 /LENGTH=144 /DNA_ID=CAMNT_0023326381 /DNA_START=172 /DNA_END=608 /DNA_ORIENTATION=+